MTPALFPFRLLLCIVVSAVAAIAADAPPEFHVRGGLPNVAAKAAKDETVRVAFLGGSITAAAGWRPLTLASLQRIYPKVAFTEIFAAVSGTGSDYGAPRLQRDVLRHQPDLLFVEFAVNDGAGSPRVEAQMEGIVRQTWAANPHTDICFVYTVNENSVKALVAGGYQSTAVSMEKVAVHYGIPSFNFGVEIARRLAAGSLVMSAPATVKADAQGHDDKGLLIFTRDKTHPTEAGHKVYAERLALALPTFLRAGPAVAHALPAPFSPNHWQGARIVPVVDTERDGRWRAVPADDVHVTTQTAALVPPTWVAMEPGAKIEFRFKGTVLGLVGIKGPENGQFRVIIDDEAPVTGTLFDSYASPGHFVLARWFYPKPLSDSEHRVRFELSEAQLDKAAIMAKAGKPITDPKPYAANGIYLSGFLMVGDQVFERK